MLQAVWNGAVLAGAGHTVKAGGNHYFPAESLNREYFTTSSTASTCPWKGTARYYDVTVDGKVNRDAAWYYPQPRPAASKIAGHVAFWHGVRVQQVGSADRDGARGGGLAGRLRGLLRSEPLAGQGTRGSQAQVTRAETSRALNPASAPGWPMSDVGKALTCEKALPGGAVACH